MRERPILFKGEMVRAVLEGRKTQTRRVVKVQPTEERFDQMMQLVCTTGPRKDVGKYHWGMMEDYTVVGDDVYFSNPYGFPGDRLWVRETFTCDNEEYVQTYKDEPWRGMPDPGNAETFYRASEEIPDMFPRWKPSIFMPRWASRILLEVVDVRVERLQDTSDEDAIAEGVRQFGTDDDEDCYYALKRNETPCSDSAADVFAMLWDSINGKPRKDGVDISWGANPWVWVVEFKKLEGER